MFYYSYFSGQGRGVLAAALGIEDPFTLAPYEILDRVLAGGELPQADARKADLWRDRGEVYEVRLAKQNFLVAISRANLEINVQEIRSDAYDRTQYRGTPIDQGMDTKKVARIRRVPVEEA